MTTRLIDDPKKVYNIATAADPTAQDDATQLIAVGCRWQNTTTGAVFICKNNAARAAEWTALEALSGGLISLSTIPTIPGSKLAAGAGVAAMLTAGLGNSASYPKTTVGAQTLLALHATKDRACLIMVEVTETFADGDGTQPTFTIGETTSATKFAGTGAFTGKTAGTVLFFAGINLATKNVLVTGVAKTGTTSTGAISVTILAIPTT